MERIIKFFRIKQPKKIKQYIYVLCILGLLFWIGFRIFALIEQKNQQVFNISRDVAENGTPVLTITMENKSGVLHEPITVENNRAYVTGNRVGLFRAGQKIGDGTLSGL